MATYTQQEMDRTLDWANELKKERDEAINILGECLILWGCDCPYCDRNFGDDLGGHSEDCRAWKLIKEKK